MKKGVIRFVHALPNAWLPVPGNRLLIDGITAEKLAKHCQCCEVVSHVRYQDHCDRISAELGIVLEPSGVNAPNPFNTGNTLVVASLTPGTTTITYVICWDATAVLKEADVW